MLLIEDICTWRDGQFPIHFSITQFSDFQYNYVTRSVKLSYNWEDYSLHFMALGTY